MKILTYAAAKDFFWFRIFGYGIVLRSNLNYPMLFSERNGYRKSFTIFNWRISFLR